MSSFAIKPMTVKLDQDLRNRIDSLAETKCRTAHWLAKEAIIQFVEREEKREALRQDTLKAWEEYQRTGQHLTHEEADAWLAKLEAGDDAEIPKWHS